MASQTMKFAIYNIDLHACSKERTISPTRHRLLESRSMSTQHFDSVSILWTLINFVVSGIKLHVCYSRLRTGLIIFCLWSTAICRIRAFVYRVSAARLCIVSTAGDLWFCHRTSGIQVLTVFVVAYPINWIVVMNHPTAWNGHPRSIRTSYWLSYLAARSKAQSYRSC